MRNKNAFISKILFFACILMAPSFYLFSADRRLQAGKRRSDPRLETFKKNPQAAPAIKKPVLAPIPEETPKQLEVIETSSNNEEPDLDDDKLDLIFTTKNTQSIPSQPGWIAKTYTVAAPLILVTLDKALGTGIAASTKVLIKQFMARKTFADLKADTLNTINTILRNENEEASDEDKLQLTKEFLKMQKIDYDQMEKSTSLSSILSQAIYIGMLNTIIPMLGTLFTLGTKIGLQALMPAGD